MTIQDVFEVVGAHAAGKVGPEEVHALESVACPGAGACGGQFTANTMSMALDLLGISPAGPERRPGDAPGQGGRRRTRPAELVMRPGARRRAPVADHHPRRRSTTPSPASPRAAGRRTACCTCWRSPGSSGIELTIDDFDTIAERTPIVARAHAGRPLRRHRPPRGRRRRA